MGNFSTSKTKRINSIEISILGIYLRKNIDHLGIKSSFHESNQCWMSFVQSPKMCVWIRLQKSDNCICSMSILMFITGLVWSSMSFRSKAKISCLSSIIKRWTCSSLFDAWNYSQEMISSRLWCSWSNVIFLQSPLYF